MKVWMIWMQDGDEATWLQGAWDDERTAMDHEGWTAEVDKAREYAHANGYQVRIQCVDVPDVYDLFTIPTVQAEIVQV
jgi:tRNA A37 N6-isopentenylltransferase MiaA